jgi:peptidoglycan/LPS O-acetylase OafA/YrhL
MKYRPEIDGLRSLAVIPVILFHAGFNIFGGGYIGVDIFFVISGYLITKILIEDLEQDKFSIKGFYERRARRILPALIFVMLLCIPFAYFLMTQKEFQEFSHSLIATSIFGSNFLFWMESGYFDTATEFKPLLHTWSLAVEEQFYILFPLFLLFFWKFGKQFILKSVFILAIVSLLLSELGSRYFPGANFYLAPSRVWELFCGSIAAFYIIKRGVVANNFFALLGLVFILCAIFIFDHKTPFPSLFTLFPVIGALLIILFANQQTIVGKLLSTRIPVAIGLISYSAYLFHQPIFAFTRMWWAKPSSELMLVLTIVVFILAYLSWRFIEKPFRNNKKINQNQVLYSAILSIVLMISLAVALPFFYESKLKEVQISKVEITTKKDERFNFLRKICTQKGWSTCNNPEPGKVNILSMGDSHEVDGYNSLYISLIDNLDQVSFSTSSLGGCPPHKQIRELVTATHPDLIKCQLLNSKRFEPEYLNSFDVIAVNAMYGWYKETDMMNYLTFLKNNYKGKVIVFGGTFGLSKSLPDIINTTNNTNNINLERYITFDPRVNEKNLNKFAVDNNFLFVSKVDSFCPQEKCQYIFDKKLLTYDQHHLSLEAVRIFTNNNKEKIKLFILNK